MKNSWHPEQGRAAHARKRMSMEKVKSYLDENYKEHITLELLSQKFYINKYYLTKIFKETYGVTIISYLETRRITQAKNLLRFTDMTVDEISAAIGMNDANYLARRFRKNRRNESGRIPEKMVKQKTANHFQQIGVKKNGLQVFSLQFRKGDG